MDLSNVWAPEHGGERLYEQDSRARGKAALDAYETLGKLAMQPAELELRTQQAALAKSRAEQAAIENDAMKRTQGEMRKGGALPEDPTAAGYELLNRLSRAGNTKEAAVVLGRITQGIQQQSTAVRNLNRAERDHTEGQIKQNATFANMLGGVTNQATLDAANKAYEQTFQMPSPLRGKPYNPAEVKVWQDTTLTANQRLQAKLHEIDERGRNWGRSIMDRHNKAIEGLREREIERKEEADAAKAKSGGKGVGKPSPGDLNAAGDILKLNQADLKDPLGRRLAAESIASRAMGLMGEVRGLTRAEALQRAYNEELDEGSFETEKKLDFLGLEGLADYGPKKTTFTGGGKSRFSPLPVPAGLGDNPAPAALSKAFKTGRYYMTQQGPRKWLGDGFARSEEE